MGFWKGGRIIEARRRAMSGSFYQGGRVFIASPTWQLKDFAADHGEVPPYLLTNDVH
jgi:hypothetical protein